jgi:hypothetical protein
MQLSAEIRWFWNDAPPSGLKDWFLSETVHGCAAGGGNTRDDKYLVDKKQDELGIKQRGDKPGVEIKSLVADKYATLSEEPFAGSIQIWVKQTTEVLEIEPNIITSKQRWLRTYDTSGPSPAEIPLDQEEKPQGGRNLPDTGCNVELTQVTLPTGQVWWTLGFESFGDLSSVIDSLTTTAEFLAKRNPPDLAGGHLYSYPEWLARL